MGVQTALEVLKFIEIRGVASREASAHPQWQTNDMGTHVKAYDAAGQILADLYIGKLGPDMVSTYVRREGATEVHLAAGHVGGAFPARPEAWKTSP
jgi:hypothetical protein